MLALALLLVATGYAAMVQLARPPTRTRLLPTTTSRGLGWVR
jgi:hypothetical protein